MPYSFGTVILAPFPFTVQSASKQRPAVIVSSNACNLARRDLIVMAITSQLRADASGFDRQIGKWQEAGLLKPSAVKPVIATLEQTLVGKAPGSLDSGDQARLGALLSGILGREG